MLLVLLLLIPQVLANDYSWSYLTDDELKRDQFAAYYKWRGLGNLSVAPKFEELTESYVKGSPCRANIIRDNCFSHNPYRAENLLKRTFN
jgi:hypothetical protein